MLLALQRLFVFRLFSLLLLPLPPFSRSPLQPSIAILLTTVTRLLLASQPIPRLDKLALHHSQRSYESKTQVEPSTT